MGSTWFSFPASRVHLFISDRRKRYGKVARIIQAVQAGAVEGREDSRVRLVVEAGEVERRQDPRQGLRTPGPTSAMGIALASPVRMSAQRCSGTQRRPALPCIRAPQHGAR